MVTEVDVKSAGPLTRAMSNIKVAVRVRPPIERELRNGEKPVWTVRGNAIFLESGKYNAFHTFDHIFGYDSTNQDVYEKYCHPIVEAVMQGFNGTIFAFGQTASGKTHTIMGNSDQPGLIPLTIKAVFNIIEKMPEREYLLRVSYMEIYNENVLDLLDPDYGKHLHVRDNADGQAVVVDLTECTVRSEHEIEEVMKNGESRRHFGSTEANQRSSRSHAIFRMVVESSLRTDETDRAVTVGQLNLVDLAGSERSEQCGESEERFRESTRINVSLTFLTQVISKLSRGDRGHINFRDSKLTRILRNSLGGNAHTAIVCTVNPCSNEQTLRTLQFASSAKKIQNTPVVNEIVDNTTLLCRYHKEIEALRSQIKNNEVVAKDMENRALSKTLEEKNTQIDELNNKVRQLMEKLVVSTRPAPSRLEWRRQRRETWAAPRTSSSRPAGAPMLLPPPLEQSTMSTAFVDDLSLMFPGGGRLSTVLEESESFQAMSEENFERVLQREERLRRSAVLPSADSIQHLSSACTSTTCSERITFLENEVTVLTKELEELKEMTKLERLLCSTSRRPVGAPSDQSDAAEGTPASQCGQLNACCVQTLLASSRRMDSVSRQCSNFYSPLFGVPTLPVSGDESSSTVGVSPKERASKQHVPSGTPCAGLQSARTVLWTPVQSPEFPCATAGPTEEHGNMGTQHRTPDFMEEATPVLCVTNSLGRTPAESVETQTNTRLSFVTAVEVLKCQGPSDTLASGQPCSERLVECGVQTEHIAGCPASPGEQRALMSSAAQTSPPREPSAVHAVASCGIQAFPDVENCASQVNRSLVDEHLVDVGTETAVQGQDSASQVNCSLAEEYCVDTGTQAVTQVANFACQVDLEFSRNQSIDRGMQCDVGVRDSEPQGAAAAPNMADCGVQTTPSTKDCATQMRHVSHGHFADREVQAVPHTRDSSTEPGEQHVRCDLLDCGVQTEPSHSLHDKSVQSESFAAQCVSCEVQVSFLTGESVAQVDAPSAGRRCVDSAIQVSLGVTKDRGAQAEKSPARDVSGPSTSKVLQFVSKSILQTSVSATPSAVESTPSNSSVLSTTADNGTTPSTSGSVGYQRFMRPGFNIFAPTKAEEEEQPPGDESATSGRPKFFPFKNLAPRDQAKAAPTLLQQRKKKLTKAVGTQTQTDILSGEEMEKLRLQVSTMQIRLETHEKASREREEEYKRQEKAAKKKEIQLKALIRQMQNRDTGEASPMVARPRESVEKGPPAPPVVKVPAPKAFESPATFSRRVRSLTPRSREAERLIYFGKTLEEQAIAEEVQLAQIRASRSSHAKQLESARKRLDAWTSRKSDIAPAVPRSPLKEIDLQGQCTTDAAKKEAVSEEMAYWPPMKYFLNPDPEDSDSS